MDFARCGGRGNVPFHGRGQTTFLFCEKEKPFGFPKKKLSRIGRVPSSIPAVLAGTVSAPIDRCRASSQSPLFSARPVGQASLRSLAPPLPIKPASPGFDGVPRASIPYGRLLPCLLGVSRPGGWRKATKTAQSSGSGKRGFPCSQTARRSNGAGAIPSKALSFGSNPFSFRKENGFAVVAGATRSSLPAGGQVPSSLWGKLGNL